MKITKYLPIIGISIFIYLLIKLNPIKILKEVSNAKPLFLLIALLFTFFLMITQTIKWFVIARVQKIMIPFFEAVKINLIGSFYGFLTPSKIGGILRTEYLKKYSDGWGKGASNFILDKILDVCSLVFLVIIFSFIFKEIISVNLLYYAVIIFFVLIVGLLIFRNEKKSKFLLGFFYKKFVPKKLKERLREEFYSFYENMPRKRYFFLFFLLNLFNWGVIYSVTFFVGLALGINISFFYYLAILPLATLVGEIPITISGLGTREATMVSLFGLLGIEPAKVFSMALITLFTGSIVPSVIGGILSFKIRKREDL